MKIRLGYVAISMRLGKKITSSSTVTFANYNKLTTHEKKLEKLKKYRIFAEWIYLLKIMIINL